MASPNASTNVHEITSTNEVVVVAPLPTTTAAIENMMAEELYVLTRRSRGSKPSTTAGEGSLAPANKSEEVPTTIS